MNNSIETGPIPPMSDSEFQAYSVNVTGDEDRILPDMVHTWYFLQKERENEVDWLTGLKKRGPLNRDLGKALASLNSAEGEPFLLVYFDVNGLKFRNDALNHEKGDELLVATAHEVQAHISHTDGAYRCNDKGDEFVLIIPGIPESVVDERMRLLRDTLNINITKDKFAPSLSFGYAHFDTNTPLHYRSIEVALGIVDRAMYVAKDAGKAKITPLYEGALVDYPTLVARVRQDNSEGKDVTWAFGHEPSQAARYYLDSNSIQPLE